MAAVAEHPQVLRERTTLALDGMTCASCAARIERALNKLDGVQATVNFATETAAVSYDSQQVVPGQLLQAVERIGYGAPPAGEAHARPQHPPQPPPKRPL